MDPQIRLPGTLAKPALPLTVSSRLQWAGQLEGPAQVSVCAEECDQSPEGKEVRH